MKVKLTLTMDAKRVAKLRAMSRRRRMTVAALVEDLTDRALSEGGDELDWVEGLKGAITGKITKADLEKDPRLAKIMGR
ncbi:MAG TPA: DUF6364 family protein [Flavobacteriales bacterium]|mgnify:CR=1 FL=1|nr:DUF6364 family protein [Flavobacteriales bacterium]